MRISDFVELLFSVDFSSPFHIAFSLLVLIGFIWENDNLFESALTVLEISSDCDFSEELDDSKEKN